MSQRDVSRIAKAAQALRELTLDDLLMLPDDAALSVARATRLLSAVPVHDWTVEVHPEVRALIADGRKINAIKRQRELTDMPLSDAKDFVERITL